MVLPFKLLTAILSALAFVSAGSDEIVNEDFLLEADTISSNVSPGRYIIEYESGGLHKRDELHDLITSALKASGFEVEVNDDYDSSIFQGSSITLDQFNATTVRHLRELDGVKNAWEASIVTLDDRMEPMASISDKPHGLTGVEELHKRGKFGKGITVGVVDTGIDYNHPVFGGGMGQGYKITGGYDFSADPRNPTNDPMDCQGHGTFVSSIIVGESDTMTGVAPEATMKMYKVFACAGTTTDDIIIAGLLKAYEEKNDIITLSLGSNQGYSTHPVALVGHKIAQEIPVLFAAGNSGEFGPFFASSGASGDDVLAIGSTHDSQNGDTSGYAGKMDDYSSWGPTYQNKYYPSVSAPGGQVLGARPNSQYGRGSGTSFACPYAAGVAALYLAENRVSASELRNKLITCADSVDHYDASSGQGSKDKAPLIQQGSGLVNALKMFEHGTKILSEPFLSLNDTVNRVNEFEITIENANSESVTYELSHAPALSVNTRSDSTEGHLIKEYFPPTTNDAASVNFDKSSLTLNSGEKATIKVRIEPPSAFVGSELAPAYSGKIHFKGNNGDDVSVGYMGVEVDTYEWTPFMVSPYVYYYDTRSKKNYRVDYNNKVYNPATYDSPRIYFNTRYGSEILSFDLVDPNYTLDDYQYPPQRGQNGFFGSLLSAPDANGDITRFPMNQIIRKNKFEAMYFQSYSDGRQIASGKYRVLSRALRMFGDASNPADWQLSLSDVFTVSANRYWARDASEDVEVTDAPSTTVVTVTSCAQGSCTNVPVTTGVTVVTKTIDNTVSEFTTFCPITSPVPQFIASMLSEAEEFNATTPITVPTISPLGSTSAVGSSPVASTFTGAASALQVSFLALLSILLI